MKRSKAQRITIATRTVPPTGRQRKPRVETVTIAHGERADWRTCPYGDGPEGWRHVAQPIFKVEEQTPVGRYGWTLPEDGPQPHPIGSREVYVTTGNPWRWCSPERLYSLRFAGECWPEWADDADPSDECREWWSNWFADDGDRALRDQDPPAHRYDRAFGPDGWPLKDWPVCWFAIGEGDDAEDRAEREGIEHAKNEDDALEQAAQFIREGSF